MKHLNSIPTSLRYLQDIIALFWGTLCNVEQGSDIVKGFKPILG